MSDGWAYGVPGTKPGERFTIEGVRTFVSLPQLTVGTPVIVCGEPYVVSRVTDNGARIWLAPKGWKPEPLGDESIKVRYEGR